MSDWRKDLDDMFVKKEEKARQDAEGTKAAKEQAEAFIRSVVIPAFSELKEALESHDHEVTVYPKDSSSPHDSAEIRVSHKGAEEIRYAIRTRIGTRTAIPYVEMHLRDRKDGKAFKAETSIRSGAQDYNVTGVSKDEIIKSFLEHYRSHITYSS
jgi:hypothetical protein